jgi:hypothetical protein
LGKKIDGLLFGKLDRKIDRMFSKKDESKQKEANAIDNEEELKTWSTNIVLTDRNDKLCETVMGNINDQNLLADIAKKITQQAIGYGYWFEKRCKAVIEKITDQNLLVDIANNAKEYYPKEAAISKLTDQSLLTIVAKQNNNPNLCIAAIKNLTNQNFIIDIAKYANNRYVREAAMQKLVDQSVLFDIAMCENADYKRAIELISDKNLLSEIVKSAKGDNTKNQALQKLGGYICFLCKHENYPENEQSISCICNHCQTENHKFEYRNNIIEHRDYESGSRWEECARCGKTANYETVNTM